MKWMRPLGNTGMEVSALGLGTVKLGRDQGIKYPQPFTIPDQRSARALLAEARELGIKWGLLTLALDVLKGLVPILVFSAYSLEADLSGRIALAEGD